MPKSEIKKNKKEKPVKDENIKKKSKKNPKHDNSVKSIKKKKIDKENEDKSISNSSSNKEKDQYKEPSLVNQYIESPETSALTLDEIDQYRKENRIIYTGNVDYKPILGFSLAGFSKEILQYCNGFNKPTPIQASTWPIILNKRDLVGIAQTGSGKTLAFTLPALTHIQNSNKQADKNPTVLILAPTRELAMQSYEIAEKIGNLIGVKSICIYGGVPKDPQKKQLKAGVQVIVATPGRLLDLMEEGAVNISHVNFTVLDEADRMLDFGFEPAIRSILSKVDPKRQTVMLSATWPESIRKLANEFLNNPIMVTIGSEDLAVSHSVTQIVEVLDDPYAKERKLIEILKDYHRSRDNRIIIFVLYKKEAVRVEQNLRYKGYKVACIQGDLSQAQRTDALARFKDGTCPLLIATDVAARGLDIPKVEYVINYTFPLTIDDYVHRIGRTGRAGNKGISHTFFTLHDKAHSGSLINVLKSANQKVPEELLKFGTTVKKKEHKAYGAFFKEIDENIKPTKIVFD